MTAEGGPGAILSHRADIVEGIISTAMPSLSTQAVVLTFVYTRSYSPYVPYIPMHDVTSPSMLLALRCGDSGQAITIGALFSLTSRHNGTVCQADSTLSTYKQCLLLII